MAIQNIKTNPEIIAGRNGLFLKGHYQDHLKASDGSLLWQSGWHSNLVVESCYILLASLMKRQAGISGILYWAVGSGEAAWDALIPGPNPSDTQLHNERVRQAVRSENIVFLDDSGEPSETPSARLQITMAFSDIALGGEGALSLREFGLFGGNATLASDSGLMIDYVIHPRITLGPGMSLTRNLHLSFGGGGQVGDGTGGFGAALPVISIDGVGRRFSAALNAAGVNTISDLLGLNPLSPVGRVPRVKLREFRAKARMVLGFRADLSPFVPLAERRISSLLRANPETLAEEMDAFPVTSEKIVRMQEALAILQVALDDDILQKITLRDLIGPAF